MYEPEIFAKHNQVCLEIAALALDKVGNFTWKPDHSDMIVDVGCGPANILVEVLLPAFKGKFAKCFGTDLSQEMIEFAGKKYGDQKNLQFLQMDIMEVDEFLGKFGQVDHVVSTFLIHYLPDQETGLKNIFKLLKPGGDLFSVHIFRMGVFATYEHMDQNAKWNKYFDNLKQFVPASQKSKKPVEDFRGQLEVCGFTDVVVEIMEDKIQLPNYNNMIRFIKGVVAQVNKIPEDRRMEYAKDFVDYGLANGCLKTLPTGELYYELKVLMAFAKKSE